eukprot:TRINITY_DN1787_c0_g1_i1.p1 TRINITY_DN1787_c0_g1~~TRINITY_DN1787_c0_g1_i1.p1  ORF type:complete len:605 (-),score=124.91 TRINITY_DN1787_c0_g1_i1:91-1836(-)
MGNKTSNDTIEFAVFCLKGRRETMEDATLELLNYGSDPLQAFFAIFDGHYGDRCALYLKKNLPEILLKHRKFKEDVRAALVDSFIQVDRDFLAEAKAKEPTMYDGSTGIVVLIRDDKIYVANTGDSRGVLCRAGQTIPLSYDHKPNSPREEARIKKNGGILLLGRVQGKLAVSRAFGDIEFKDEETLDAKWVTAEPDVLEFDIDDETEFLILACDGLWDKLSNEDAVRIVRRRLNNEQDIKTTVQDLVNYAYESGSTDNISAIVVSFRPKKKTRKVKSARSNKESNRGVLVNGNGEEKNTEILVPKEDLEISKSRDSSIDTSDNNPPTTNERQKPDTQPSSRKKKKTDSTANRTKRNKNRDDTSTNGEKQQKRHKRIGRDESLSNGRKQSKRSRSANRDDASVNHEKPTKHRKHRDEPPNSSEKRSKRERLKPEKHHSDREKTKPNLTRQSTEPLSPIEKRRSKKDSVSSKKARFNSNDKTKSFLSLSVRQSQSSGQVDQVSKKRLRYSEKVGKKSRKDKDVTEIIGGKKKSKDEREGLRKVQSEMDLSVEVVSKRHSNAEVERKRFTPRERRTRYNSDSL